MKKILSSLVLFAYSMLYSQAPTIDNTFNPADNGTYQEYIGTDAVLVPNNKFLVRYSYYNSESSVKRINADGSFDTTFNSPSVYCEAIYAKSDGKFITLGGTTPLRSYFADGTEDTSFTSPTINYTNFGLIKLLYQEDGKIMIVGPFTQINGQNYRNIVRLNSNGSIDTSFNPGTGFSGSESYYYAESIARQNDGKYLVGGGFNTYNGITRNKIVRILENGNVDTTFNTAYILGTFGVLTGFDDEDRAEKIIIQPDNKILVQCTYRQSGNVVNYDLTRLNADGTRDGSFVNNYINNEFVTNFFLQNDGKIIVSTNKKLSRRNSNNSNDLTFTPNIYNYYNSDGIMIFTGSGDISQVYEVDGKLFMCGNRRESTGQSRIGIFKLNMDGTMDMSFNSSPSSNSLFCNDPNIPYRSLKNIVLSDGSILVLSNTLSTAHSDIPANQYIYKLNENGTLNTSFNLDSRITYDRYQFDLGNSLQIYQLNNGKIIIAQKYVEASLKVDNIDKKIIRINADGSLDETFNFQDFSNSFIELIVLNNDKLLVSSGTLLKRYNQDGTEDSNYQQPIFTGSIVKMVLRNNISPILLTSGIQTSQNKLIVLNNDGTEIINSNVIFAIDFYSNISFFSNDKILIFYSDYKMRKYNSDGSVDTSFPALGVTYGNSSSLGRFITSDNRIIICTISEIKYYNSNGVLLNTYPFTYSSPFHNTLEIGNYSYQGCDKLIMAGVFNKVNGITKNNIVRINISGNNNLIPSAPTGNQEQTFSNGQTLANLIVNGENITWYDTQNSCVLQNNYQNRNTNSNVALPLTTPLVHNTTYYASQTVNGIESSYRLPVRAINGSLSSNTFSNTIFKISPNPTKGALTITSHVSINSIEVYDLMGKKIVTDICNSNQITRDYSYLESGVYLIKIYSKENSETLKFVKN